MHTQGTHRSADRSNVRRAAKYVQTYRLRANIGQGQCVCSVQTLCKHQTGPMCVQGDDSHHTGAAHVSTAAGATGAASGGTRGGARAARASGSGVGTQARAPAAGNGVMHYEDERLRIEMSTDADGTERSRVVVNVGMDPDAVAVTVSDQCIFIREAPVRPCACCLLLR